MNTRRFFRAVSPYLGVLGVVLLLVMLLGTIYFTWLELQWTAFLAGILVAAILALISRASRSEWILTRRTAQLAALRDKLAQETAARLRAEESLAQAVAKLRQVEAAREAVAVQREPPAFTVSEPSEAQALYAGSIAQQLTGWDDVARQLQAAIDNDEFCLYCQTILRLASPAAPPAFYEILNRLKDEENNLLPPGAFLPLAERYGMLPALDRWVVRRLLQWVGGNPARGDARYSINVSGATVGDAGFARFVQEQLAAVQLPGSMLCFEFSETEAAKRPAAAAEFVRQLRLQGCRLALCGVGRDLMPFELLKRLQVDFLKIDSRVIFNVVRDPVELAKVRAISRAARAMGIGTIAELVESEAAIALLREAGIDFAQGFAVSQPQPLESLEKGSGPFFIEKGS
jgi:EAL domain-containing protein (putative c-di-GMP-specific phosphodiesterase class I)